MISKLIRQHSVHAPSGGSTPAVGAVFYPKSGNWSVGVLFAVSLVLLYFSHYYHYLLFHSLAEIYSICIAYSIFIISWNAQRYMASDYLLFIGIGYLFIGTLDLFHTLSYKGMRIFLDYDYYANQLWIAARYLEALTLLVAFHFLDRKKRMNSILVMAGYFAITVIIMLSIFTWKVFPVCFVEGKGLTQFKVASEYAISAILLLTALYLVHYRHRFDGKVFRLLLLSVLFTIASELAFTFYVSNYDFSNLIGHYFKILSFFVLYKAIVVKGISAPFALIFRELKIKEEELVRQNKLLEEQTRVDSMTGLFNSRTIMEYLEEEVERAVRYGSELSIVMLDIDRFKLVNDTFGHQFGDEVIAQVSRLLREHIRKVDLAGRAGGEEFLVILPQTNRDECLIVAEKIRTAVEQSENDYGVSITISGGTASYGGGDARSFLKTADDNLYRAKNNGRNRIER